MADKQEVSRALMGLSAGLRGDGPQYLAGLKAQDMVDKQQQQAAGLERAKAMVKDAQTLNGLLSSGNVDQGLQLVNNRIKMIGVLGGDPSDTMRVKNLLESGDVQGAQSLVQGLLVQARSMGLLEQPEQIKPNDLVEDRFRVTYDPITGQASSTDVFEQANITPQEKASTTNMGLSPVWLQDANGKYVPAQLSSGGGLNVTQLPEGMTAIPSAGQMAYDPAMIQQRGTADTQVEVGRTQALTPVEANQAGAVEAARQQAQTDALAPRAAAEREATLTATSGTRGSAIQSKEDQIGMLKDLVGVAKDQASVWTTGFLGSNLSKVPGTPAYDLGRTLDTLQASAGFDKLQEMRDNSPTGGALGQVTERELALLQATWGSLQQSQSKDQFEKNLDRFQTQLENSWNRVNRAYERDYGEPYFGGGGGDIFSQADAIINGR